METVKIRNTQKQTAHIYYGNVTELSRRLRTKIGQIKTLVSAYSSILIDTEHESEDVTETKASHSRGKRANRVLTGLKLLNKLPGKKFVMFSEIINLKW